MDPWSVFWRQGHSTTFGDYFKDGYVGAIADWWRSKFDQLPTAVVIMEVGCGNGSLLPLLVSAGVRGRYIGVDLAAVTLSEVAKKGLADSGMEVLLHSETPAERIPEADASVDLVASVFGIEYSDFERSLPEVLRLVKPGGRFCALLHHDASVVTSMSRRAIAEFHTGDLSRALVALNTISTERDRAASATELKTNPRAEQSREALNLLAKKYLSSTDPATANATMFDFMTRALQFFKLINASSEARRQYILALSEEHQASHELKRQMVSVAFDAAGIEELQSRLIALGFAATTVNVIHNNDNILAWGLCASK